MKSYFAYLTLLFFIVPGISWAQVVTISGYVRNAADGQALENVSIFEKQSGVGTITNQDGFYKLILQQGEYDLTVSDNGFQTFERHLDINANTTVEICLSPMEQKKVRQKKTVSKQEKSTKKTRKK